MEGIMTEHVFQVGDKVTHKFRPAWGIGTIKSVDCGQLLYDADSDGSCGWGDVDEGVEVEYPAWKNDVGYGPVVETWYTKIRNLVLVEAASPQPKESFTPAAQPVFRVGDTVTHRCKPEWGKGVVVLVDNRLHGQLTTDTFDDVSVEKCSAHLVKWEHRPLPWYTNNFNMVPDGDSVAACPASVAAQPKYKVGDKVTHKHRPDWGVGTVVTYLPREADGQWDSTIDFFGGEDPENVPEGMDNPYEVVYQYCSHDLGGGWFTCEENLIPAEQ
jgi:hypothetical protein